MSGLFDGVTIEAQDVPRLSTQLARVRETTSNGAWWTLERLVELCGGTEASISARLRDLRKHKFGGYVVERKRVHDGLHVYRVLTGGMTDALRDRR